MSEYNVFSNFHLFRNFLFLIVVGGEFAAQWFIISIGGKIFRTVPLPFNMILTSVLLGAGSLLVALIVKRIF